MRHSAAQRKSTFLLLSHKACQPFCHLPRQARCAVWQWQGSLLPLSLPSSHPPRASPILILVTSQSCLSSSLWERRMASPSRLPYWACLLNPLPHCLLRSFLLEGWGTRTCPWQARQPEECHMPTEEGLGQVCVCVCLRERHTGATKGQRPLTHHHQNEERSS